jgi:hypothetical protein
MQLAASDKTEKEYDELNAFLSHFATAYWGFPSDSPIHPANVGREIVAQFGKTKALVGLRQAINDVVEEAQDFSPTQVSQLDSDLRELGIVTLSELRQRHSRQYKAIRKRGTIRNEGEFYLVKAILEETAPILDPEELNALNEMIRRFELGS